MKQLEYSHCLVSGVLHISQVLEDLRPLADRISYASASCEARESFDIDRADDRALLRRFLDEHNIRGDWLHTEFGAGLNLVTITEDAAFERHRAAIAFAGDVPFKAVVLHGGVAPDEPTFLERAKASLGRLLPWAEDAGVTLAVEAPIGPPTLLDSFIEWRTTLGNAPLALCLDTGHANCWQPDFLACARQALPHACCLHVHDNDGIDDQHRLPGEGTIPWDRFIDLLIESGYDGAIGSECVTSPEWPCEDIYERFHEVFERVLVPRA